MQFLRTALLAVLVLAFLAGCANTAAKRTASGLDLDLVATGNEGFVVLKVVSTQPISLINPKWQSIKISSDGYSDEMYDITPTYNMLMGKHVPTESLYFAKLKAGEYEVTGMGSIGPGPGLLLALLLSDRSGADPMLPQFTVQAGKLANLGTIVYVPEIEGEQSERMFLLNGLEGKKAAYSTLLSESNRFDVPLVEGGGWASSATAQVEADVLAQARHFVSVQSIWKSRREVLAGSHLGVLFRRTGPQAWSRETIDTLGRVSSVAYAADGRIIVGSDYGEYFVRAASGEWQAHRLPQEAGRIAYIEPRADGSAIFVAADLQQTRLWLKKSVDGAEPPSEIFQSQNPPDNLLVTGRELIFAWNIPGIMRETAITRIDKETLAVSVQTENFWVADWQYLPDGTVALNRQNGRSLYTSTWVNNQRDWVHTDSPGFVSSYWYDAQHGLSLEASAGFTMVSNQLGSTSDGGKTWTRTGKPLDTPHFAGQIVYADADEVLLKSRFFLYSTTDHGQTWRRIIPADKVK